MYSIKQRTFVIELNEISKHLGYQKNYVFTMSNLFQKCVLIVISLYTFVSPEDTWFGTNNQYMCHCEQQPCESDGFCVNNGKCQNEWFGPQCQYQDLTHLSVYEPSSIDILFDRNDLTCINDWPSPIYISWSEPIVFTWLRLVVNDTSKLSLFTLKFYKDLRTNQTFSNCSNRHQYIVNNTTLEIKCDVQDVITKIEIHGRGVPHLCSLYINGGRNMALKQHSKQSSTYTLQHGYASIAVDGIVNQNYNTESNSCTHTDPNDKASTKRWTVNIPLAQITRYVIYNRKDCCRNRLNNFQVLAFSNNSNSSFLYKDKSRNAQLVTTVLDIDQHNVSTVTIQVIGRDRILTLCEVQIFGECVPGAWGLNCEKNCSDLCSFKDCSAYNRQCYGSCIGSNILPACQQGPWFGNDNFMCHCDSWSSCDFNGICENNKCAKGWFGFKCQYQDLATLNTARIQTTPLSNTSLLTDRDDTTCISGKYEIIIVWNTSYPFSWIKLKLLQTTNFSQIQLMFNKGKNSTSLDITCTNKKVIPNQDQSVDIRCEINETIQQLKISQIENVCSMYVNGGRNVALSQPAWQSSTYSEGTTYYWADKAVDGNRNGDFYTNSCTHTNDISPQFNVSFSKVLVYRIDIYNRFGQFSNRLSYFNLSLFDGSEETFNTQGDDTKDITLFSIYPNINTTASKIIIDTTYIADQAKTFLTLCEVEVFGECVTGTYGLDCKNECSDRCYNKLCNIDTGVCEECIDGTYGNNCFHNCSEHCGTLCDKIFGLCFNCESGYKGEKCDEDCEEGKWGLECNETCTDCFNQKCNATSGFCEEGCYEGYTSDYCNKTCNETFYGRNCNSSCSNNCTDNKCSRFNGICDECYPGYKGDYCESVCETGKWGSECNETCSKNCFNKTCNASTGVCLEGCQEGYQSDYCNDTCDQYHFGKNCLTNCSDKCQDKKCHAVNGTCLRCPPGLRGPACVQDCSDTTYGQDCQSNCSVSCLRNLCHPVNGNCFNCSIGRFGNTCDVCLLGKFGENCLQNCSARCTNGCNNEDGRCYSCVDGYLGDQCDDECNKNNFGPDCSKNCSANCKTNINNKTQTCHHVNGSCFNGCTDGYHQPLCLESLVAEDSTPVGAIVGSIIAVLAVAAIIIIAVILWRKRKSKSKPESQTLTNLDRTKSVNVKRSKPLTKEVDVEESNLDSPDNTINIERTSIPVHELTLFMQKQKKDFFTSQFKNIPTPENVSTEIAFSAENKNKNRYKNICPYDHSRVHLKINTGKKQGDYINASYIRGYNEEAKFIAAQGPNNLVINDFVRMLWEQNIKKVVMLTNHIEEGKVKCEKYWPDSGKVTFGEIEVKLIQTQTFTDYCIRKIELSKQAEESHIVTHFHFTTWPDQNVPYAPWALLDFQQKVFETLSSNVIVVHCSAGVGRTGTFIALYNVLRQAEETGYIDFYNTVTRLREDRILMIQTADQYEFLHRATQAALACLGSTFVSSSNIKERMKCLEEIEFSGLTKMKKEFQVIDNLCKDIRNSHKDDHKEDDATTNNTYQNTDDLKNCEKNRFPSIVPRDADRPYLTVDSNEKEDYINAVFIPGLQRKDQHILTQLPMPTTVVDFWRLVVQYKVDLVVAFEKDKLATDKTIAVCIPNMKNMSLSFMPFDIKCDDFIEDELWNEHTLTVFHEKSKSENHKLIHLECKFCDLNSRKLLTLVKKIRTCNVQTDGKILYMCRNGATYSGLCCAVSLLLDRMDNDSCASVLLVVGLMKTVRQEIIPKVEQYKLLYDVLERYTDVSSPYTNVDENFFPKGKKQTKVNNPRVNQAATDNENIYNNV